MKTMGKWALAVTATCIFASAALADAFRTADGKVIAAGLSRGKVLALLGQPQSQHVETVGVDTGETAGETSEPGRTIETWTYFTTGPVGNEVLLTLTLEAGEVVDVKVEQPR